MSLGWKLMGVIDSDKPLEGWRWRVYRFGAWLHSKSLRRKGKR